MSPLYEAVNLRRYYESRLAFAISSFRLEKGASLVLTGPNGSGKSTFLRMLAFLETPSEGILRYFGGPDPRRECTLVLQEPWLMRSPVFKNVVLGLKLRGRRENLREKFENAMLAVGFENPADFAQRKPFALSGGEKQRVALAARLILDPVALLLDEPTAYVDGKSADRIVAALKKAREAGVTIVCATHDRALVSSLDAEVMELRRPDQVTQN